MDPWFQEFKDAENICWDSIKCPDFILEKTKIKHCQEYIQQVKELEGWLFEPFY